LWPYGHPPKRCLPYQISTIFISEKFPFYRKDDKKWKNSIRHALLQSECFQKVPRQDEFHGRRNFWIIDSHCDYILENGNFQSRTGRRKTKTKLKVAGGDVNISTGELYTIRTRDQSLYMPNEVDSKLVFSCNSSVVIPAIDEQPRPTASEPDRPPALLVIFPDAHGQHLSSIVHVSLVFWVCIAQESS